jgi:DNA polymerase
MSVDFQEAYLKEIGVQTPISSFAGDKSAQSVAPKAHVEPQAYVEPVAQTPVMVAEPQASSESMLESPQQPEISVNTSATVSSDSLAGLKIKAEACKACELVESRNKLVFGEGNAQADLLFIAEAPGRDEDLAGKPFVGVGGTLFERMLVSIGIQRDDVYMMHGVKCRPQHNRDPKPVEFAACESFLTAQVEHVQPKVICMLGRVVAQTLLKTDASLTELRAGRFSYRGIPVLVIDHPSYLLRAQQNKRRAWQDLCRLQSFLQTIH